MGVQLTLEVYKNDALVASRDFDRDIIKIGRLASAHLCLDDEKVSRIHSVIEVSGDGGISIIDMGSVEGTWVNGKRVNKGALSFGDEIKVGNTTIKVTDAAAKNLAAAAASVAPQDAADAPAIGAPAEALAQAAQAPIDEQAPVEAARAQVDEDALDPSFASTQKNPVVRPSPKERIEVSRPRPQSGKKLSGPVGLSVRFMWGDQMLTEHLLRNDKKGGVFTVGTAPNVGFVCSDAKLGTPAFELVRYDAQGFNVRFNGKMKGELTRRGETMELRHALEAGHASNDGETYSIAMEKGDFAWIDLGGITVEVMFKAVPKPVFVPFADTLDFFALNIFLVVLCLGAFFAVTAAISKQEGAGMDDELSGDQARIAKLIFKPAQEKKNDLLKRFEERKQKASGEAAMKSRGDEGKAGKKNAPQKNARMAPQGKKDSKEAANALLKNVFGGKGTSSVFGANDVGGALKNMTGNLFGASAGDSQGLFGKGLKGGGGGGGGDSQTIGISGVKTSGRGGGDGQFGNAVGVLGGKKGVDIGITSGEPEVQGSLDKELIRKVIRDHRDQIRFCYESQLQRHPKLAGKVAVKFLITANGTVAVASVSQSTTGVGALDSCVVTKVKTWLFPKPKGGGTVTVNYPFNFKMAGE